MITLTKAWGVPNANILGFSGKSTDVKPIGKYEGMSITNGSEYKEIDTGNTYSYDAEGSSWYLNNTTTSGGGSGANGITPHIGENGNWFIGSTDTGVSAEGENGGYYIPAVTQPSSDKLQISFAPSKSDMPAVNPVIVNLPVSENSGQNPAQGADLTNVQTILRNVMTILRAQVEDEEGTPQAYRTDISGLAEECDALIAGLTGSGGDGPDEPEQPEKTLTSISATYSGGEVAVGTALNALTGIVVTAHYSDGSSEAVTGYTLSGSVAEGENTITVSYGGKTAAFTVTGTIDSGGGDESDTPAAMRGVQLPALPSKGHITDDENWLWTGYNNDISAATRPGAYLLKNRLFTGTIYTRETITNTFGACKFNVYLVGEDFFDNPAAGDGNLQAASQAHVFDGNYVGIREDLTGYLTTDYNDIGTASVKLQKFEIPDGKFGVLAGPWAGNDSSTIPYKEGWCTVFFEDPTDNILTTEVYE